MWKPYLFKYFLSKVFFFSEILKSKFICIYTNVRDFLNSGCKFKESSSFLKDNKFMLEKSEGSAGGDG